MTVGAAPIPRDVIDPYISDVFLYALKAGAPSTYRGAEITAADVTDAGLEIAGIPDRWMVAGAVVDLAEHRASMISQRGRHPTKRSTDYPGDSLLTQVHTDIVGTEMVRLAIPGVKPRYVEVEDTFAGSDWDVNIHGSGYPAVDLGDRLADVMSAYLDRVNPGTQPRDVRLFASRLDNRHRREVRPEFQHPDTSEQVNGADGAAILAVNAASLREIQRQTGMTDAELSILRARANIVIEGLPAFAERYIAALHVGELMLRNVGPGSRCTVTGVDQITGERDDNRFLTALSAAGQGGWSAATGERGLFFGFNLQPALSGGKRGRVRRGDRVRITWRETSDVLDTKPAPAST